MACWEFYRLVILSTLFTTKYQRWYLYLLVLYVNRWSGMSSYRAACYQRLVLTNVGTNAG